MSGHGSIWCGGTLLVYVGPEARPEMCDTVDDVLNAGAGLDAVLGALSAAGLAGAPSFLCVAAEAQGLRAVVRGSPTAEVRTGGGTELVEAMGAVSWREMFVDHGVSVLLSQPDSAFVVWRPACEPDVGDANVRRHQRRSPLRAAPKPVGPEPAKAHEGDIDEETIGDVPWSDADHVASSVDEDEVTEGPPSVAAAHSADANSHATPGDVAATPPNAEAPPAAPGSRLISGVPGLSVATGEAPVHDSGDLESRDPGASGQDPTPHRQPDESPTSAGPDEDDMTISLGQLRRAGAASSDALPGRPEVQAIHCPAGHPNPPVSESCRICGNQIDDRQLSTVSRPVLGRLRFATGAVVDLDRPQLIGRRPAADTAAPGELPGLVTVPSPDGDISRLHIIVHVEGWDVLVEDVGSTNGTEITLPGKQPERLREHDPRLVVPGTDIVLAGSVRCTLEVAGP